MRIERRGERALWAELAGRVGRAHALALTEFADACMEAAPVNVSLFQDLSRVTSLEPAAQMQLAAWAREKAPCLDRLHFVVGEDPALVRLVRAMFMALPVRAYLHRDQASFAAALARLAEG